MTRKITEEIGIEITRSDFNRAYEEWRDELFERDYYHPIPWTPDSLFQCLLRVCNASDETAP